MGVCVVGTLHTLLHVGLVQLSRPPSAARWSLSTARHRQVHSRLALAISRRASRRTHTHLAYSSRPTPDKRPFETCQPISATIFCSTAHQKALKSCFMTASPSTVASWLSDLSSTSFPGPNPGPRYNFLPILLLLLLPFCHCGPCTPLGGSLLFPCITTVRTKCSSGLHTPCNPRSGPVIPSEYVPLPYLACHTPTRSCVYIFISNEQHHLSQPSNSPLSLFLSLSFKVSVIESLNVSHLAFYFLFYFLFFFFLFLFFLVS